MPDLEKKHESGITCTNPIFSFRGDDCLCELSIISVIIFVGDEMESITMNRKTPWNIR